MTIVRKLLVLVTAAVLGVLLTAGPASASHPAYYVKNDAAGARNYVKILRADHSEYYTQLVAVTGYSDRYARDFEVIRGERVLYKSIATGALYWSGCGEDLPTSDIAPPTGGGWQNFGASIQLTKRVSYPTAPANVCSP